MNDIENKIIKEVIASTADPIVNEILVPIAKPAAREIGDFFGTVAGFFNHVVAAPLKRMNASSEAKTKAFIAGVQKKYETIPEENRRESPLNIVGPTLEALKYNIDEEEFKEMFKNLLVNSMNIKTNSYVHPMFVEIIKQMNQFDAVFFKNIVNLNRIKAINPNVKITNTNNVYTNAFPEWFIGLTVKDYSFENASESLIRLSKFGLLDLMFDRRAGREKCSELKQHPYILQTIEKYKAINPNVELSATDSIVMINDLGRQFAKCCFE